MYIALEPHGNPVNLAMLFVSPLPWLENWSSSQLRENWNNSQEELLGQCLGIHLLALKRNLWIWAYFKNMFLYVYMTPFCKENRIVKVRVSCLCEKFRRTNAQDPISYLQAAGGWETIHSPILFPVLLNGLSFDSEHMFLSTINVCFCCVIWKCLLRVRPKKGSASPSSGAKLSCLLWLFNNS